MSYDNWRKRLQIYREHNTVAARRAAVAALKINFSQPQPEDEGYYRKPQTEPVVGADGKTNGQKRIVGWTAVAYFMHEGKLAGVVGTQGRSRNMKPEELTSEELWSYVVANPIPYEWYKAVVEDGQPWPDAAKAEPEEKAPAPVEGKRTQENVPDPAAAAAEAALPEHELWAKKIDAAISAMASLTVTTDAEMAIAEGSNNRLAELRLKANKIGEARYKPLYVAYTTERDNWVPMVNRAAMAEKNTKAKILKFQNDERARKLKEAQEAEAKQRAIDEANQRTADRAIAAGVPEQPPPATPAAEQPAPTPAPARVAPTYGTRTTRSELKKFAIIESLEDQAKVYEFFKTNTEVQELLLKLATNAIRAGVEVPGTTIEEKLA